MLGLLIAVASVVAEHRLWGAQASVVAAGRLSSCGTWAYLPLSVPDVGSLTRDQTHVPCIGKRIRSLDHQGSTENLLS